MLQKSTYSLILEGSWLMLWYLYSWINTAIQYIARIRHPWEIKHLEKYPRFFTSYFHCTTFFPELWLMFQTRIALSTLWLHIYYNGRQFWSSHWLPQTRNGGTYEGICWSLDFPLYVIFFDGLGYFSAGILQSMGARNRVGIVLSYCPAGLCSLAGRCDNPIPESECS